MRRSAAHQQSPDELNFSDVERTPGLGGCCVQCRVSERSLNCRAKSWRGIVTYSSQRYVRKQPAGVDIEIELFQMFAHTHMKLPQIFRFTLQSNPEDTRLFRLRENAKSARFE